MARFSLIKNNLFVENRFYDNQPIDIPHKSIKWLPCPIVTPPTFNPTLEIVEGPVYNIGSTEVVEQWTKRNLTAPELDALKQASVDGINGVFKIILKTFLIVANDIRDLRAKVNAVIDATGIAGTVTKYTAQQSSQVTLDQLKTFIKNNL